MNPADLTRLVVLAALWGGSFIFMRIIAPAMGPVWTAGLRVLIGGSALLLYFLVIRFSPQWRAHFRHYVVIGILGSGIPFLFYSYAALHLPASLSAIINSTSPLFGAVFAMIWLGEALTKGRLLGLGAGIAGVALASWRPGAEIDSGDWLAMAACLGSACCYGLNGTYIKRFAGHVPPLGTAGCSQIIAGVVVLAFVPLSPMQAPVTMTVAGCLLGLALLCSSLAFVLYYRLIANVGPAKALTVTFLIPAFGMLWAAVFLRESITAQMLAGVVLIIAGTTLVVRPKTVR